MAGEGKKRLHTALANQHYEIPSLIFGTDEKRSTRAEKHEFAAALAQKRKRVFYVAIKSFSSADRCIRGEFGSCRVVGNIAKTQKGST